MQELTKALCEARKAFASVVKDKHAQAFKGGGVYKYADLSAVLDATVEPLAKHGLVLVQPTEIRDGHTFLQTILLHTSGQSLKSEIELHGYASGMTPQQWGSAHTYARRYQALSVLGIAPEDDDAQEASKAPPRPQPARSPQAEVDATLAKQEPKSDMLKPIVIRDLDGLQIGFWTMLREALTAWDTRFKRLSEDEQQDFLAINEEALRLFVSELAKRDPAKAGAWLEEMRGNLALAQQVNKVRPHLEAAE